MKTAKKLISVLLLLGLLTQMTLAMADWSGWTCPVCGKTGNTLNFCPDCAAPRPDESWTCPNCGQTGNTGNFCGNCAHPRPSGSVVPGLTERYVPVPVSMPHLEDSSKRRQSQAGPSRQYPGAGAYKPYKVRHVDAFFVENGYVLVHLEYQTVEDRFLYFPKYVFASLRNVPEIDALEGVPGITPKGTTPSWGPGAGYTTFENWSTYSGEPVTVFFRQNGYVYAEYSTGDGMVRMWLPENRVEITGE